MQRVFLHFAAGAALLASALSATAMGFGQTVTQTTLGQPLNFVATVTLDGDETIARECVFAEVYAGDIHLSRDNVRATLEPASESGRRRIRVTTTTRIDEPVVDVEVSVGCNSRLSRRFVAFIDPPGVQLAEASAPADVAPPPTSNRDSQSMMLSDMARNSDASRRGGNAGAAAAGGGASRQAARTAPRAQRVASARSSHGASRSPAASRVALHRSHGSPRALAAGSAPPAGPRLQLDPPMAVAAPRAAASAPPAPTIDAPAWVAAMAQADAASAALKRERDRIEVLEAGLAKLRADSAATQRTLGALQLRLREAEGERYANGLVYFLAGLALLFALIALALWLLRPRQRRRARWFDAAASQQARAAEAAAASHEPAAEHAPEAAPLTEPPTSWNSRPGNQIGGATVPASIGGLEVTTVLGPEAARLNVDAARAGGLPRKTGELSMEELIDLEQQAEFFVVLGQEEAAIALLDGYMHSDGGKSPLPYLQLLELHQRRTDRAAYEEVRQAFNERFQAFAPEWSDDIHFGRELEEYPQTIARLQSLWPTPLSAMQALDSLLFRRHSSDDTFDFPAYRELLFLYSIARELSGHVETDFGSIDVLLPLEDAPIDLTPTTPDGGSFAVDLDVSSWPDQSAANSLIIHRVPGRRGAQSLDRRQPVEGESPASLPSWRSRSGDPLSAVGVERRHRDRRDADLGGQPAAEPASRLVATAE